MNDYNTLYDRVFNNYDENMFGGNKTSDDVYSDFNWTPQTGGDSTDGFYPYEYWRGILSDYFTGGAGPSTGEGSLFESDGDFSDFWNNSMKSNFTNEGQDGDYGLGYFNSQDFDTERMDKLSYKNTKETALDKALGNSKSFGQKIGKAGFAGGSKGGIIGESSMWDDYKTANQNAGEAFSGSQRSSREGWLDNIINLAQTYSSS